MKSYTDIEQSKKLAEILPIESADMFWIHVEEKSPKIDFWKVETIQRNFKPYSMNIPCWSLAPLLDILNYPTLMHEFCGSEKEKWFLTIKDSEETYRVWENDPIDACYEMILKLHEPNLL